MKVISSLSSRLNLCFDFGNKNAQCKEGFQIQDRIIDGVLFRRIMMRSDIKPSIKIIIILSSKYP